METIKTVVLELGRNDLDGESALTLLREIEAAVAAIPDGLRDKSSFELMSLRIWYERPETDADRAERAQYERLKLKFG